MAKNKYKKIIKYINKLPVEARVAVSEIIKQINKVEKLKVNGEISEEQFKSYFIQAIFEIYYELDE